MNIMNIEQKATQWTRKPFDDETQQHVQNLINNDPKELYESFYKDIDFGTGGMRGIMGVGSNRINKYTLGQASEGLSRYIRQQYPDEEIRIAIANDTRNNSKALTDAISSVFASHGFRVFLFDKFAPTPLLSYAVRQLKCHAGVMLTASHNPPEYNGYKVYWNDGGQIVPPHDKAIISEVRKTAYEDIQFGGSSDNITRINDELIEGYYKRIKKLSINDNGKKDIKIVFTPLHGTTVHVLPAALEYAGFNRPIIVDHQATPDGNFPTVESPNPEEASALKDAVKRAEDEGADLVIGTDPDGDRIGIGVRNDKGEITLLNGNQTAAVMIRYLLSEHSAKGTLPVNGFVAKTIVTTDLISDIAKTYNTDCLECLTGFKWIADLIRSNEGERQFIGGGEESYGYLVGDFVRDKDANISAVILAEIVSWAKQRGSSFWNELMTTYKQYGYYHDQLHSLTLKGSEGAERIDAMMAGFRSTPPKTLMGQKVVRVKDYKTLEEYNPQTDERLSFTFEPSNVIQFFTSDGARITVRPSGTEPKIKFYFSIKQRISPDSRIERYIDMGKQMVDNALSELL
jgi:phosphoglucomutase